MTPILSTTLKILFPSSKNFYAKVHFHSQKIFNAIFLLKFTCGYFFRLFFRGFTRYWQFLHKKHYLWTSFNHILLQLWINSEKALHTWLLSDIIFVFSLWITSSLKYVIHKLWIRCGQVILACCRNLSTSGGYCRNSTLFPIICFSTTIVSYIYKLVGCTACITLFFHGTFVHYEWGYFIPLCEKISLYMESRRKKTANAFIVDR